MNRSAAAAACERFPVRNCRIRPRRMDLVIRVIMIDDAVCVAETDFDVRIHFASLLPDARHILNNSGIIPSSLSFSLSLSSSVCLDLG